MTDAREHLGSNPIPADSIDAVIAKQIPDWIRKASVEALRDLHLALRAEQAGAERVRELLKGLAGLVEFSAPKLEKQLQAEHNINVDVRKASLCTVVRKEYASMFPLPPVVRVVRTASVPLLSAALHNFALDEVQARPRIRRRLEAPSGAVLPVSFVQFAKLSRELDLGGLYQNTLHQTLLPADEQARQNVANLLEESSRSAMEAAVRIAALKGLIDEHTSVQLLSLCDKTASGSMQGVESSPASPNMFKIRQLYVLGKCVHGVVTVEVRDSKGAMRNLLVWIPGDPVQAIQHFRSWDGFYEVLGLRLHEAAYASFFGRFIAERDRISFSTQLEGRKEKTKAGKPLSLDCRNLVVELSLFRYLRSQRIDKILDDAKVLAIPTGVKDAESRNAELRSYASTGLALLGLAGFFVPLLGEVMLGIAALQVADEVYEGYQDWKIGDRQAALGHLFSVAETIVVGAALGAGATAGARLLERVSFVDELIPVVVGNERLKLCSRDMSAYRVDRTGSPSTGLVSIDRQAGHLRLSEGDFQLASSRDRKDLLIRHPTREDAYRPLLERNGSGGWRHALEQPQEWQGEHLLLQRLAARFTDISPEQATAVLDCTGFDEAQLRRLNVENAPTPARLQDALDRYRLHAAHPAMDTAAFDMLVAAAQEAEEVEDALLRRHFPGLSVRGAKEIRQQVNSGDLELLNSTGRVSLAMAERARWFLRDSRLDRACAGLRQASAVNTDTERLALGLVQELAAWPDSLRVELREGSPEGDVLGRVGAEVSQQVICIVREKRRYSIHDLTGGAQAGVTTTDSLMNALLLVMGEDQKLLLGDAMLSESQLVNVLAAHARLHRDVASRLIGQGPVPGAVRPPVRFADGRLGYPLSGRGNGRAQASRRGIRQIFPTLNDEQLQRYVLDAMAAGADPWSRYERLHEQWMSLRQGLASWRAEYVNILDLLRRSRVVRAIRRCWRRKAGMLSDGTYALEICAERVGRLPGLPQDIMFEHVTRLVMRDMALEEIDADFLRRFPNLRELDLRDNRLLSIPAGLEHLPELRQLRLDNNQIIFALADNERLRRLRNLEDLEINFNPLGIAPEVRGLLNLRNVGLRGTALAELPENLQQLPWRGLVDLRENQIQQVNQDLQGLRARLEQMELRGNPLDEASERYVQAQPGPSSAVQPVVEGSPSYREHLLQQAELSQWLTGAVGALRSSREQAWLNLRNEPGSSDFFHFLHDLGSSPDFLKHPMYYRARVWAIIEACEQNGELRELMFAQAGGVATCEDRVLWLFSQLEVRALVHRETAGLSQMQSERALVRLGRSLYRLQEVDRAAAQKLNRLREAFANEPARLESIDDIETYLAYRVGLAGPLQLPAQPVRMHYLAESLVTVEDINVARAEILSAESDVRLRQSLADQSYWQDYLRNTYFLRFRALVDDQRLALEHAEALVTDGTLSENTYLEQCKALTKELEKKERALIEQLTQEAFMRWQR